MGGAISFGGIISGLDTNAIITQLMQLERQPVIRLENRVAQFQQQQTSIRDFRTQLTTLRDRAQDFRLANVFSQYRSGSSEESVLTSQVGGENPVSGSYTINVQQLASATVARSGSSIGAPINPAATLASSGLSTDVVGGTFTINGVAFTVDPATQSLNDILNAINASGAGVTATYDAASDTVTMANVAAGDTGIINFGASGDDSNFLSAISVQGATQATNANGSTSVTSTRNVGAAVPGENLATVTFAAGTVTSGTFKVNGITISIDTATDSLADVVQRINDSDAGVMASYDTATDSIRVVSETLGSRTIRFESGTSNFLDITHLTTAAQEAGKDALFTVNGGAVQTRNSNQVSDAIGGITLNFLSQGTSTVTVGVDDDAIVEDVQAFLDEVNASLTAINDLVRQDGILENDFSIRVVGDYLRSAMFSMVAGGSGDYQTLLSIGISTGDTFDSAAVTQFELDEETFREALRNDSAAVRNLFTNEGKSGIGDTLLTYLDEVTGTSGYLNQRARSNGTIDQQVQALNERIERMEIRLEQREARMRAQFLRVEQMSASAQNQNSMLSRISSGLGFF